MNKLTVIVLAVCVAMVGLASPARAQEADDGPKYRTKGEGMANEKEEAVTLAVRAATTKIVKKALGDYEAGRKQDWIIRLIAAHPRQVVQRDMKVLSESDPISDPVSGKYSCEVEVTVSKARVDAAIEEAKQFVEWIENPTVAVVSEDTVEVAGSCEGQSFNGAPWGGVQKETISDQGFKEILMKTQFEMKEPAQGEELRKIAHQFEELATSDLRVRTELLTEQPAEILIIGRARVSGPSCINSGGVRRYLWKSSMEANMYWSDDGSYIATLHAHAMGHDTDLKSGSVIALQNAGQRLADAFVDSLFERWSVWVREGRLVNVQVVGVDIKQAQTIGTDAAKLPEVLKIESRKFANSMFNMRIRTEAPPFDVAAALGGLAPKPLTLEVESAKPTTIKMRAK